MSQLLNKQYYSLIKVAGVLLDVNCIEAYMLIATRVEHMTLVLHNGTEICMLRAIITGVII